MTTDTSTFETLSGRTDVRFPEYDHPPTEPDALLREWMDAAERAGVREPRAMALATADRRGRCSSRVVAVGGLDATGVLFATHRTSTKGREIDETGWASGLLYWRETGQQITLSGPTAEVDGALVDRWWARRPAPLHAMSTASHQSEPLPDPERLRAAAAALGERPLPRPERFVWYRIVPENLEFWCASPDRLHRRLAFVRHDTGWEVYRKQP